MRYVRSVATMTALFLAVAPNAVAGKGGGSYTPDVEPAPARAPALEKPDFLKQQTNGDLAYCHVVLSNERYHGSASANMTALYKMYGNTSKSKLMDRADESWTTLAPKILPWTEAEVAADVKANGEPRLSAKACLDVVDG